MAFAKHFGRGLTSGGVFLTLTETASPTLNGAIYDLIFLISSIVFTMLISYIFEWIRKKISSSKELKEKDKKVLIDLSNDVEDKIEDLTEDVFDDLKKK